MRGELVHYGKLLEQIKSRIQQAQTKAVLSANAEMIRLYWDIGRLIDRRQQQEGWGAKVIPRLSKDIRNELPEIKGFSERNIGYMIRFAREYDNNSILQQPVARLETSKEPVKKEPQAVALFDAPQHLQQLVTKIPWGHHILLMEKVKDLATRFWYMGQSIEQGWSRNILTIMIENQTHKRQGAATTNFQKHLPDPQSDLATQALKDPYIFDFLTLTEPFQERELETELIRHLEKFLLELGQGFAFVGRQFHLDVGDSDFYIDLLFYHLKMRCFIVIELKKGTFRPEYAGKMNFYCSAVDDLLRHKKDQPTIGLILCQDKNSVVAEYALRDMSKPIGISEYELTRALPDELKSCLPSIEEIEAELLSNMKGME